MDSVWILEYRTRERKNSRWSEWQPVDNISGGPSAYSEYPSHLVFAHDHHERRAVEFVRLTTGGTTRLGNDWVSAASRLRAEEGIDCKKWRDVSEFVPVFPSATSHAIWPVTASEVLIHLAESEPEMGAEEGQPETAAVSAQKWRKNPVVIEAAQFLEGKPIPRGVCFGWLCGDTSKIPHVHTMHDNQRVDLKFGDWIIPEPDGEHFYPCDKAVFAATYAPVEAQPTSSPNRKVCPTCGESGLGCDQFGCWNVPTSSPLGRQKELDAEGKPLPPTCEMCGQWMFRKEVQERYAAKLNRELNTEAANLTPVSPLGRQDEHPSGYDNPLTMDRILQLAHVLCKCPPEYRSSWSCDPCRAFAELIFFRQSAATPVSVGGEDAKK